MIDHEPDLMVCGESEDEADALACIAASKPDVLVTDLALKDSSAFSLIKNLNARRPKLPILVVSLREETVFAERVMRAGAKGYLMKGEPTAKLLAAIRCLLAGQIYLSETMQARMLAQSAKSGLPVVLSPEEMLSDRELEVFELLGQGMGTRQVAEQLHVAISTVETHRAEIKKKLGLESGTELLQVAAKWVGKESTPSTTRERASGFVLDTLADFQCGFAEGI